MARSRASDFELKRRAILDSAAVVFARQGMDKASMAQIARQSDVSKALLYHYFPGKDSLVFAIIQTHIISLEAALRDASDDTAEPSSQLARLITVVLEQYRGAEHAHQVQINCGSLLSDEQRAEIRAIERRILRIFSDVLVAVNPSLRDADSKLLMPVTMSLFGMLNWVYTWFREDGALSRSDYASMATAMVLDGVRSLPAKPPPTLTPSNVAG